MSTVPADIDAALAPLTTMMRADGYELTWEWAGEGAVAATISATADACAECLAPKNVIEVILRNTLQETPVTLAAVTMPVES